MYLYQAPFTGLILLLYFQNAVIVCKQKNNPKETFIQGYLKIMELAAETKELTEEYLEIVRNDSDHNISPSQRFKLYQSFGPSRIILSNKTTVKEVDISQYHNNIKEQLLNLTTGDKTLGWLGILTSKKVLFLWESIWQQITFDPDAVTRPEEMLELAEKLLLGKTTIDDNLFELYGEFNTALNIEYWVSYDVANTFNASYFTLEMIIYGPNNLTTNNSDDIYDYDRDFASRAVAAYTVINSVVPSEDLTLNPALLKFDPQKRLEFWEWWLTEAIPQAWELAQSSY